MKIAVLGTGYVGLVTGVCLAEIGHSVTCIDVDEHKVDKMAKGTSPIYEPGLAELMKANIDRNRLMFTTSHEKGLEQAEAIFIAVGTPQSEDGSADLSFVIQASKDIASNITNDTVVIVKSTVPVGTNQLVRETVLQSLRSKVKVDFVSNPEFLREGHAISDTFHGDRIVIGADDQAVAENVEKIFKPLGIPVLVTGVESAELIKYAANAFLATKISFINEMANLCEKVGANVQEIAKGMGMDHRIGSAFLNAGIGYGGSCFPKDTHALVHIGRNHGYDFKIIKDVIKVNKQQPLNFVRKVLGRFETLKNINIAVLGLAFKANTDDMREAPSVIIINELLKEEANLIVYDPVAIQNAKKVLPDEVKYAHTLYDAVEHADVCLILTEWDEFKTMDLQLVKDKMRIPIIFDGRSCLPIEVKSLGIEYHTVDSLSVSHVMKEEVYI